MSAASLPVPGLLLGAYPERRGPAAEHDQLLARLAALLPVQLDTLQARRYGAFAREVGRVECELVGLADISLAQCVQVLRERFSRAGFSEALLVEAFALLRETCRRVLGRRPYDAQLIAARIMLDNRVAEMATGEGKTLAAGLCAAVGGLAGVPVHVITVNDYLVERDASLMRPLFTALGLSTGHVTAPMNVTERRAAYGCDITYCTARELVFDYLRDRVVLGPWHAGRRHRAAWSAGALATAPTLLRGLCMAVVDEVDSILIDEARIPLVLSEARPNPGQGAFADQALAAARGLCRDRDFRLDGAAMQVRLTDAGRAALEAVSAVGSTAWHNRMHREETVCTALAALHLYHAGRQYLVRDGKVLIIDEATGRLAPGRVWSRGLHQMIELKEGCAASGGQVTAAQITYQRFFRRYLRLGGMSGTVREARGELAAVHALPVVRVGLRLPGRRKVFATRLFASRADLWQAVICRARAVTAQGRPVLIGTDSVAESEELAMLLAAAGVAHEVLNARNDAGEAAIVAGAGAAGRVTVATNMAGRGTDIPLGPGVAERGGLHVICCQHNASRRIDRQLIGRCARQGEPGSAETLLSLDKPRLARVVPSWMARRIRAGGWSRPAWLAGLVVRLPQWLEERDQRHERRELLARDTRLETSFAVAGVGE